MFAWQSFNYIEGPAFYNVTQTKVFFSVKNCAKIQDDLEVMTDEVKGQSEGNVYEVKYTTF